MSKLIPREFIHDIVSRIDIVDLIDSRIQLKKAGKNFHACCPFHQEKTPSFTVSPTKQFYHCFGCGKHGNAISFLMEYEHASFVEAIEILAHQLGLTVPRESQQGTKPNQQTENYYSLMSKASNYYQGQLRQHPEAEQAIAYLKERGLTGTIAKQFLIGYAPSGWRNLSQHIDPDNKQQPAMIETGLLIENDKHVYDRFRKRIIFPIRDTRARIIGFGGRVIDNETPKYLNSPESPIFHKGRELYGLYEALQSNRKLEHILIVEGYMDVIALAQHGITDSVATLGTATTKEHLIKLFRYTSKIIFCFDGDAAGKTAAWRALEVLLPVLQDGKSAYFLFLDQNEDPDTTIRQIGTEAFKQKLQQALPLTEFFFSEMKMNLDLSDPQASAKLKQKALPLIEQLSEGVLRQHMLKQLGKLIRIDADKLTRMLDVSGKNTQTVMKQSDLFLTPVRLAIILVLQHPELAKTVEDPDIFATLLLPGVEILHSLFKILKKSPHIKTGGLLEYWRDDEVFNHLTKLASFELGLPEEGLPDEFQGALKRIKEQNRERQMETLLTKASLEGLSEEEKRTLQQLINKKGKIDQ